MNIRDPIWGSIIPSASNKNTSRNITAQTNNSTAIVQNQTHAIVSAISTSGGYLWSFKFYWIITTPVTFATILLPLVAGPTTRYVVKFSYHNRAYARLLLSFLGLAGVVILATLVPVSAYFVVFGFVFGALALGMLSWASVPGRDQLLWATFAAVFAYSLLLDLYAIELNPVPVTGTVPLVFLILVLFRSDIRRLIPPKIRIPVVARLVNTFRESRRLRRACVIGAIGLLYILLLIVGLPRGILLVPLCILAVNRLVHSYVTGEHAIYWGVYDVLLVISTVLDYLSGYTFLLPFVPIPYVFAFWIYQNCRAFFTRTLHRIRGMSVTEYIGRRRRRPQDSVELSENGRSSTGAPTSSSASRILDPSVGPANL